MRVVAPSVSASLRASLVNGGTVSDQGPITRGQFVTDRETPGSHLVTSFHVTHRKGMVTSIEANPISSRLTCNECEEDLKEIV